MANIKGTQVKDLPISEAIIESDVFVKQNTTSRQTQSFTAQTLSNYARQELDIDTIEDNIEDLQTRTTNIEKKGLFGVWSADATYGLYAIVFKNNAYWRSLQDHNINHDPEEPNSEWWEQFLAGNLIERVGVVEDRVSTLEQNALIRQKLPTSDDPTWYKIYANGWCEQGGTLGKLPATRETYRVTVIFNVPFVDINYTLLPGEHNTGTGEYPVYNGKTTTSFDMEYKGYCCWFACGLVDVSLI